MIERTAIDATGAHWFEVLIDPPEGHLPIWTMATWFLVRYRLRALAGVDRGAHLGGRRVRPVPDAAEKKQWPNLVLQGVVALEETAFFDWFDSVKIGKIEQGPCGRADLAHER